ncbi:uncharacterized protein LOC110655603 [Hevea brasiliensis]|uniref:uncharacterized protein LOC110655603 n=1 Tax=Hevea brasiliensis TaxID=3981 RepID=UPI0025D48C8F|nr:uncharacterized protein LOC110655603 [Hevea brasiliensis]
MQEKGVKAHKGGAAFFKGVKLLFQAWDLINQTKGIWDKDILFATFNPEDCIEILKIPLTSHVKEPELIWNFSKNGAPSVKVVYHMLKRVQAQTSHQSSDCSLEVVSPDVWSQTWSVKLPPKIKNFIWRCCLNVLATKENLYKRHCSPAPACPLCDRAVEMLEHWKFMIMNCISPDQYEVKFTAFLCWHIRKGRNATIFQAIDLNPNLTIRRAKNDIDEVLNLIPPQQHSLISILNSLNLSQKEWNPPCIGDLSQKEWNPPGIGD